MIRPMSFRDLAGGDADRAETARFLKKTFAPMVGAVPGPNNVHIGFDQGMGAHDAGPCRGLEVMA